MQRNGTDITEEEQVIINAKQAVVGCSVFSGGYSMGGIAATEKLGCTWSNCCAGGMTGATTATIAMLISYGLFKGAKYLVKKYQKNNELNETSVLLEDITAKKNTLPPTSRTMKV